MKQPETPQNHHDDDVPIENASSLFSSPVAAEETPLKASSSLRPPNSTRKCTEGTPDSLVSTPATATMTPMSEDSGASSSPESVGLFTPLHVMQRSTAAHDSPELVSKEETLKMVDVSLSTTESTGTSSPSDDSTSARDPSPPAAARQQEGGGRALFREDETDTRKLHSKNGDDPGTGTPSKDRRPQSERPTRRKSSAPPLPPREPLGGNSRYCRSPPASQEEQLLGRSRILRSRRPSLSSVDGSLRSSQSSSQSFRNNNSDRRRSAGRMLSDGSGEVFLPVYPTREEITYRSSEEDEGGGGDSSTRSGASSSAGKTPASFRRRQRRRQSLSPHHPERSSAGLLKSALRFTSTKWLVWLLCLIGLTCVSMIAITNHRMATNADLVTLERRDHVTVLFRPPSSQSTSTEGEVVPPPSSATDGSLRGGGSSNGKDKAKAAEKSSFHSSADEAKHRTAAVNLNKLSQRHEDSTGRRTNYEKAPADDSHRHQDHDVKHHDRRNHQDDKKKSDHGDEKKKSDHHHSDRDDKKKPDNHHDDDKHHRTKPAEESNHHHKHEESHRHSHGKDKHSSGDEKTKHHIIPESAVDHREISAVVAPERLKVERNFDEQDSHLYSSESISASGSINKRVVVIAGASSFRHDESPRHRTVDSYPAEFSDNTQLYSVLDSGDEALQKMERREPLAQGECVPMREWQTTFHPSCNSMHEHDWAGMGAENGEEKFRLFGTKGFWRNAWRLDSLSGRSHAEDRDTVVLKTLKINHRFEDAYFENNRIDAVVLERLTASPHVINIFGFCGHSVVTEFAEGKRLGELADKKKNTPLARLKIARDVANGLADVHGIDGDGNATFVHLDINPANVVSIGGTLKLNDFNIGVLRRWSTKTNKPCGIPTQYPNPQWRSPEEARNSLDLTEKVDIFSMGHIFFRLICGHEPWHKFEPGGMLPSKAELNEKVRKGILPTIPKEVMDSTDPEVVAIREAMMRCYTFDPVKRPSARDIANSLQSTLDKLEQQEELEKTA